MSNDDATRGKGTGTSTPAEGSRAGDDDGCGCCERNRDGDGTRPPLLVAARAVAVLAGAAVVGGTAAPVDALAAVPWVALAVGVAEVVRWRRATAGP